MNQSTTCPFKWVATQSKQGSSPLNTTLSLEETVLYRTMALFGAIRALSNHGLRENTLDYILDLAAMGERLVEDEILSNFEE